jgi:putative component of membrane protein insertase Oxa1/YidC/SpoIIIJ protein YidD
VQEHGVVVGGFLTVRRILCCHPWATGGIDDVPRRKTRRYELTRFGFVVAGHGKG